MQDTLLILISLIYKQPWPVDFPSSFCRLNKLKFSEIMKIDQSFMLIEWTLSNSSTWRSDDELGALHTLLCYESRGGSYVVWKKKIQSKRLHTVPSHKHFWEVAMSVPERKSPWEYRCRLQLLFCLFYTSPQRATATSQASARDLPRTPHCAGCQRRKSSSMNHGL